MERFLQNENALLKERNHTLIFKNENLKEAQEQLQEEHELVCHQSFIWNKSRKTLKKQNRKLQVKVQIYKRGHNHLDQDQWLMWRFYLEK